MSTSQISNMKTRRLVKQLQYSVIAVALTYLCSSHVMAQDEHDHEQTPQQEMTDQQQKDAGATKLAFDERFGLLVDAESLFRENRRPLLEALDTFRDQLDSFRAALDAPDDRDLLAWWHDARARRRLFDAHDPEAADDRHDP